MKDLTLLIPTKNETESLPKFLQELEKYDCKKLLVVDNKDKNIYNIDNFTNVDILVQSNSGYGNALIEGINNIKTKFFCIINADGSMDPIELKNMYLKSTSYNFIFGTRYGTECSTEDDTFVTMIGNYFFSLLGKIFFKLKINDILYTFILGETECARSLNLSYGDFRICVEIPIKVEKKKLSYSTNNSNERKRIGGKKKVNAFKDGTLILGAMINLFFKKL